MPEDTVLYISYVLDVIKFQYYRLPQSHTGMFSVNLFIYLGFYIAFNTIQVISRRVVGRVGETSTYSWSRFCTVTANQRQATTSFPT